MNILFLQFLLGIIFLSIVFLHIAKKNSVAVMTYCVQSLAIIAILFNSFFETNNLYLLLVISIIFIVKAILAPIFLIKLIKKHALRFSASTYFNAPIALIIIAALTAMAYSQKFISLVNIIPNNRALLSLALAAMFISFFLIINRKGALSQIIGILSLENSIVAFAFFAGLEQSLGLQIGIIFDISVWIIIATVFTSMIYKHFGTLDVTEMKHLKD